MGSGEVGAAVGEDEHADDDDDDDDDGDDDDGDDGDDDDAVNAPLAVSLDSL